MSRNADPADFPPLYLCAPVNALMEGIFEARISVGEIRKHGDFGLGTFNDLDGEMVVLDGLVYRVDSTGKVHGMSDDVETPFACITRYRPLTADFFSGTMNHEAFEVFLKSLVPSFNLIYAFRIEGRFDFVKTRSVPRQERNRPLVEVAAEQPVFTFEDVEGTLVGFYTPFFLASLNVPGFHLHFLTGDFSSGGHLLECRPRNIKVNIQFIYRLELSLPLSLEYLTQDFSRDTAKDIEKAEK